jgi:hypothetical protein
MPHPKGRYGMIEPTRRELFGGLAVLTILACVGVARQGAPNSSLASSPIQDPLALVATHSVEPAPSAASVLLLEPAVIMPSDQQAP